MAVIFHTATSANGYLADTADSLDWLFAVPGEHPAGDEFMSGVTAMVLGATTYAWLLRHERLLEEPEKWQTYFGSRPAFVFTHREIAVPCGADVRPAHGAVSEWLPDIRSAAGDGDVWVQGGGDLAGQFLDAGALDEITLHIAPVFLADGRPLLPRDVSADRLSLSGVEQVGEFVVVHYTVGR